MTALNTLWVETGDTVGGIASPLVTLLGFGRAQGLVARPQSSRTKACS